MINIAGNITYMHIKGGLSIVTSDGKHAYIPHEHDGYQAIVETEQMIDKLRADTLHLVLDNVLEELTK